MKNPQLKLKKYRESKGVSQRQLAQNLGIGQGYISKIENGLESPTIRMLYRIAYELEICPHMLLPCTIYCKKDNNCECEVCTNENSNI
jgi:predicted transcriptional regulator